MNKNNFLIAILFFAVCGLNAQEYGPTVFVEFEPTGKINRVELPDDNGDIIGHLLYKSNEMGLYELGFDFSPIGAVDLELQFRKSGRTIYSDKFPGGPSGSCLPDRGASSVVYNESFKKGEDDLFWFGVLAVAACCVQMEISVEGGEISGTIGFDCKCFTIELSPSVYDQEGNEYNSVDEIVVTAY